MDKSEKKRTEKESEKEILSSMAKYNYESNGFIFAPEEFESALELDIFLLMINQLKPSVNVSPTLFHSNVVVLEAKWFGNVNYNRLKDAVDSFQKRRLQFESKKDGSYLFSSPFTDAGYHRGKIIIEINPKYMPYFLELGSGFARYLAEEILSLKTLRMKKLFRILSVYQNMNSNQWVTDINKLMKILKGEKFGKRKADFINKIVQPSINAINKKTSLEVNFEIDRSKTPFEISFHCGIKGDVKIIEEPIVVTEKQNKAYLKLIDWGVAEKIAKEIALEKCDAFWSWNFSIQEKINDGKITSPGALAVTHFGYKKKANE